MATYLLDTNVISRILRRREDSQVINYRLQAVLRQNAVVLISPIVFYEIARGLYLKEANSQLAFLEDLVACFMWCDLNKTTWDFGAKLWADCRKKKMPTPTGGGIDKDVLIAAQAKEHNAIVITDNVRHFQHLGVNYESW
jgi:predicted nucleic acid-binding protein